MEKQVVGNPDFKVIDIRVFGAGYGSGAKVYSPATLLWGQTPASIIGYRKPFGVG